MKYRYHPSEMQRLWYHFAPWLMDLSYSEQIELIARNHSIGYAFRRYHQLDQDRHHKMNHLIREMQEERKAEWASCSLEQVA